MSRYISRRNLPFQFSISIETIEHTGRNVVSRIGEVYILRERIDTNTIRHLYLAIGAIGNKVTCQKRVTRHIDNGVRRCVLEC